VKGEYNVYPNPHLTIIPTTKRHTHTTIPNIKKTQEYTHPKKNREKKNMKKNHINFTHPNKWSDSLAS